jgi:hypothetical protein
MEIIKKEITRPVEYDYQISLTEQEMEWLGMLMGRTVGATTPMQKFFYQLYCQIDDMVKSPHATEIIPNGIIVKG